MIADFISIHPILTYIIIGVFIGISAMVAVVVTIITYTNIRSARRNSAIAAKDKPLPKTQTVSAPVGKTVPKHRTAFKPQFSILKKKLAFIILKRSPKQTEVSSDPTPVEQAPPVPEIILNATNLEPEKNATEFSVSLPSIQEQPASEATEVATLIIDTSQITDASPVSLPEASQPQEKAESINPEETSATEQSNYHEQPSDKDDMFSMFTNDTAEESPTNKFAADLSHVDVNDLLAEALKFRNQFSKVD